MKRQLLMSAQNKTSSSHILANEQLFDLYDQMLGDLDIINVLHQTSKVVKEQLNAERATIYLVLKDTQELESVAIIGNVSQIIRVPIKESSLAGYCALEKRAFVVPDAYGDLSSIDPRLKFDSSWDKINDFCTRDVICVPALLKGEVMGVIQVINSVGKPFTNKDLDQLKTIARFSAYTLYHSMLYDELASLKRLEKEKASFMRILVHELRSPVTTSKSLISALQYTNKNAPKLNPIIEKISKRMDQLIDLMDDILQLSHIKSGNPLGEINVYNLTRESEQICKEYSTQAKIKGLDFNVIVPNCPLPVRIDMKSFHLILSNLMSNAIKYTSSGFAKILIKKENSWAIFKIEDSGIGIPEEDIAKLFKEFFRASNAKKNNIQGTGVGLAGVKDLVERFSGQLEFESKENKGSQFIVRLPLYRE